MLTAKDIMTTEVITLSPEIEIGEAARILLEKKINGAPVVDGGKIVGILCQSDLVSQQKTLKMPSVFTFLDGFIPLGNVGKLEQEMKRIAAMNVGEAMTEKAVTVQEDTSIDEVAAIMVDRKLYTLPVVRGDELVGVVGKSDVLRTLTGK